MHPHPELTLTLRVAASAADSRRGIVRVHREVLAGLGMREWDALEIVGARRTAAVVAAAAPGAPTGVLVVDEVVAANCGLAEDSPVTVRPAQVTGASSVTVQGLPPAASDVPERVLRSVLLGKVVRVGDSVTLLPRDLGPDFPTGEATASLRARMGAEWGTRLLTVTATTPAGVVSVQPSTAVHRDGAGVGGAAGSGISDGAGATPAGTGTDPAGGPGPGAADPSGTTPPGIAVIPRADLVGVGDQAEVLDQWLTLALDRAELLHRLGAAAHLGVLVTGPAGVGKATLVRSVCAGRRVEVLDGPSTGALETGARLEAVRAAAVRTTASGGVLLVTDVDALLPATPEPVGTLVLEQLRAVVEHPGCALVATCVRADDTDDRLRAPELCDRRLELGLPGHEERAALLGVLLAGVPAGELDLAAVADRTPAFVVADLRALCREAALRAAARVTGGGGARDVDSGSDDTGDDDSSADDVRIEQSDLLGAISVIRPLARADVAEFSPGSVTLDDVGDMEEVRAALTETVLWPLQHPEAFDRLGVAPARGVLLYGPPGCGKTFLVRALAATGRLTVHTVKGAELMDKWVGSSEQAVRDLFRRARDSAPSLVFLDEVDALAPRRGQSSDSGVGDRVVAALLTELDGAEPLSGVVVLGATNRPELIDPALLRPGRLERLVFVPPPDAGARAEILRAAGRDVPLADDVDLAALAAELEGYSAADCASLLREAALTAMRRDMDAAEVTAGDVVAARTAVRPSLDPEQVADLERYARDRRS